MMSVTSMVGPLAQANRVAASLGRIQEPEAVSAMPFARPDRVADMSRPVGFVPQDVGLPEAGAIFLPFHPEAPGLGAGHFAQALHASLREAGPAAAANTDGGRAGEYGPGRDTPPVGLGRGGLATRLEMLARRYDASQGAGEAPQPTPPPRMDPLLAAYSAMVSIGVGSSAGDAAGLRDFLLAMAEGCRGGQFAGQGFLDLTA